MQSQKAVSAYFASKQILPFDFAHIFENTTPLESTLLDTFKRHIYFF